MSKTPARGKTVERVCKGCGKTFHPREADVKRGWGKFCSKSCKAIKQEKKTGACSAYFSRQRERESYREDEFSNAHLFSNEE